MRGILLAGGTGSRLGALSKITNKHLLPIGFVPMIYHPLSQFICNNITEICIVSGVNHLGAVISLLGSGKKFGCSFTYKVQDKAGGIAEALNLCKIFSQNENLSVLLGDNIFNDIINMEIKGDAVLFLKKVKDPERFGVAEVDHMKRLVDIEEKPKNPKSDMAITGAYVYSPLVWKALDNIKRSERGELEISDVNKWLLKNGAVNTKNIDSWWSDAGTQESYKKSNENFWTNLNPAIYKKLDWMSKL